MLTKSQLDQYIKDGQLVPIGTELMTVQGGNGKIIDNAYMRSAPYLCEFENGPQLSYTKDFKYLADNTYTSLIDPTPTTVESPFSRTMLARMFNAISQYNNPAYDEELQIINHLLTAANDFPKMMEVSSTGQIWYEKNVIYADPMNRFFVVRHNDQTVDAYLLSRPIQPKPKELKDLVKGDNIWDKETLKKELVDEISNGSIYYNKIGSARRYVNIEEFDIYFQLTPPIESQIAQARQSAIDEVNKRFDGMEKEATNV